MDNYSLEDVKSIVQKNLLTKDVLKKILVSTSRRIDIYNDYSEIDILRYLKDLDIIDKELKEEIDKYIYKCENYVIENKHKEKKRETILVFISLLFIVGLLICIYWR